MYNYITTSTVLRPSDKLLEYSIKINNKYIDKTLTSKRKGEVKMYSVLFTSFLVIILIWKFTKLRKNKKKIADYESLDEDVVILLNEGDRDVRLPKKKQTKYRFQKLKMCKKCHHYSVLKDDDCPKCGTVYVGVESLAKSIYKNRFGTEVIAIILFVSFGSVFAPTSKTFNYSLIAGFSCCIAYVIMSFIFSKSEHYQQLNKLFYDDLINIKSGIAQDIALAQDDVLQGRVAAGYDRLREIGDLIYSNQVKIERVRALNKMALRKDMELVLEPLIPTSYDRDFVKYALEVLKINRTLVTKKCIAYFSKYRIEVMRDFGMESLLTVVGTVLRMKLYILEFSEFIQEFIEYLPKERLHRLCSIINSHPEEEWGGLEEKVRRLMAVKYPYDPDFKSYFLERSFSV